MSLAGKCYAVKWINRVHLEQTIFKTFLVIAKSNNQGHLVKILLCRKVKLTDFIFNSPCTVVTIHCYNNIICQVGRWRWNVQFSKGYFNFDSFVLLLNNCNYDFTKTTDILWFFDIYVALFLLHLPSTAYMFKYFYCFCDYLFSIFGINKYNVCKHSVTLF
jgi:hypothetical protein